jgi:uncharacterized protein (DUF1330 family)
MIVDIEVTNQEPFEEYGGRFAVRGGRYEALEGNWQPQRTIMVEFPDFDRARQWHDWPEYQALVPLREQNARTNFMTFVEGI